VLVGSPSVTSVILEGSCVACSAAKEQKSSEEYADSAKGLRRCRKL
jgi:hypothetical protein